MARAAASNRTRWGIVAIAGVLVVGALIAWRLRRSTETAAAAQPEAAHEAVSSSSTVPAHPTRPALRTLPPAVVPDPAHGVAGLSSDDPLTAYRKTNVYPPTSRPLTPEMRDLLYPNTRAEAIRPTDADDGVQFLFTADRYFVIGSEALDVTLEVRRDGTRIPVTIVQSFAAVLDPVHHDEKPIPFTFTAKDSVYAYRFAPASLGLKRQAAIGMYVEFDYGGGRQRAHFDFEYTPAAGIPAKFTGVFRDAVERGSLVIHAGVDVTRGGPYLIDANLYDAQDRPVGWTRFKGELAPGAQTADLMFFGKVLVDAHAAGPFHLGQLRGARFDEGHDPDLEQMPSYAGTFTTQAYPADAFSDAEWDSPEKQHMLDVLAQQKALGLHQGAARPADPGSPGDDK